MLQNQMEDGVDQFLLLRMSFLASLFSLHLFGFALDGVKFQSCGNAKKPGYISAKVGIQDLRSARVFEFPNKVNYGELLTVPNF